LTLGANEQNAAALCSYVTDAQQSLMQQRHGLAEVDNVDVGALTKDETLHLWVPTVGLVTKVCAHFEQLAHGKFWHCHGISILFSG
jgi:hypothetical protein